MVAHDPRVDRVWPAADAGDLDAFVAEVARTTDPADYPLAARVERNVPVYEGGAVRVAALHPGARRALTAEWVDVLSSGPGIIVIAGAFDDVGPVDRATAVFESIIEAERRSGAGAGDHFAKPGANDRIWNSLEKHCLADPEGFAAYYASPALALPCEAWLGPAYQVTAQVNRVNPGGDAQVGHRDYHLGFMTPEQMARYPAHVHRLSPVLTLQGGVAHCDMPVESGPTMVLPYSQRFLEGYLACSRPEFRAYFDEHRVQLPLAKGDALFFNPALMHGAGANRTNDVRRMANLLQVSSPLGRAMETVDREAMVLALYPVLLASLDSGDLSPDDVERVIAASAEGYPFPTDLDRDPPTDGLAPPSQADLVRAALAARHDPGAMGEALRAHAARRSAGAGSKTSPAAV